MTHKREGAARGLSETAMTNRSALISTCAAAMVALLANPAHAADGFDPSTFDPAPPPAFQFGESVEAHAATFASDCTSFGTRTLPVEEMPLATESHMQVDCEGFEYYGAPRLAEFVFADGALTHVWVLTGAEDLPGMQAAFDYSFGAPSHHVPGAVMAYMPHRAVLRFDTPEALYMSEAAAPFFAAWFDGMVSEQ